MRIAVVGAGIVGVTTAYELAADGHVVTVYERQASVASGASFANAGVVAPGYVTPWAAPGMPRKVLAGLGRAHAPVRLNGLRTLAQTGWLWRWWRACRPAVHMANRQRMLRLARYSRDRLQALTQDLKLDYDQASGLLVLLRSERDLRLARPGIRLLADAGVAFHLLDADRARRVEPALNPDAPLRAAIHLPADIVGNCRQYAQLMRDHAQRLGVRFEFGREVLGLRAGHPVKVVREHGEDAFDAAVVCAGPSAAGLLRRVGLKLPIAPVWGYSITAPVRHGDAGLDGAPRAALMDEAYKVAITRLGDRVRVAGSAEIGGRADDLRAAPLATLYRVLEDWFPGAARTGQAQQWKGARPMLPDGPPVLGASGRDGIWLNVGHGSSGWALSAGSARVLADLVGGRDPGVDLEGLGIERFA